MLLYVYDKQITLLGVVEKVTSLVWTENKYTYGTFTMLLPITDANLNLLTEHRLLIRDDDEKRIAGEILYRRIRKGVDGGEELEVSGRLIACWLADRIMLSAIYESTLSAHELMQLAVRDNLISPLDPKRIMPLLKLGTAAVNRPITPINYTNKEYITVLEVCEELATGQDIGFFINVSAEAKQFYFNTYTGEDHTIESQNPCIFSVEYENILEQEYTASSEEEKSAAYVRGDPKSDYGVMLCEVGWDKRGFERKEIFVDASKVKEGEQMKLDYKAALVTNGEIALEQCARVINFHNKINTASGNFIYGKHYGLGDKVTCVNSRWGIAIDAVITEAQTTYEEGQREVFLTFGSALPNLSDKLKNMLKR